MMKQQVEKIFNDLDAYLDFCRYELREFNPAHLYDKSNYNYRAFLVFKNKGKDYKFNAYHGKKRNKNYSNKR